MARQFIYHMQGLTKAFSGGKKVLENIHLSFYPDAKIGVLGPNGSGKSTLLRIMAGLDKEFSGEAWAARRRARRLPAAGAELDPSKDVKGNVMLGVAAKAGDPRPLQRADDELLRRDGGRGVEAAGPDRFQEPLGPRIEGRDVDGRARLPARRCRREHAFRRREAPRRALQAPARGARPAPPRRADQPSRRGDRRAGSRSIWSSFPARC